MVSSVVSRVLWAGSQTVCVCVEKLTLQAGSLSWITLPNSGVLFTPPGLPFPTVEYCLHPLDYPSQQWSIVYTPWELFGGGNLLFSECLL